MAKFTYTSHSSQQNHTFQQESGTKIIRKQTSSKIIQLIVQCFLLFAPKKDHLSLVFFATKKTKWTQQNPEFSMA